MAETPQSPTPQSRDPNLIDQAELDRLTQALEAEATARPTEPSSEAPAPPEQLDATPPADETATPTENPDTTPAEGPAVIGSTAPVNSTEAAPLEMTEFAEPSDQINLANIDLLDDVELDVKIELGRTQMYIEDVLRLGEGSVVELDKLAGDPVDVYVNDRLVARGEVLVLNDNFCVRINDIISVNPELEEMRK
ncbi:MAG TPA: flagellar motor switch protein FliN [Phycisphaerae bacterium]|jgi:flagellar motor switch protein FliN/FliY|nr:flagellar motor switch protein FliN [Phycisphaerae bacterium]HPC21105.1 flagellar motor switch protein FliN [Phycisphaerae bacterium]HRS26647.1 flagellar motor switch protein FliN [Phycisphaerae bacterium]HRT42723.1 flagellar motor switch protein FliN [Phycisphaerae bacterium]